MIVDYNKFTPRSPLLPGTLTILEQWPRFIQTADVTDFLLVGYWQSYNKPFFREGFERSGNAAMYKKFGDAFSYELNPRAKIFRRDAANIEDRDGLKKFMRYIHVATHFSALSMRP